MKKKYFFLIFIFESVFPKFDATVIGVFKFADGLGRDPIVWVDILKDDLKINYIPLAILDKRDIKFNLSGLPSLKDYYKNKKKLKSDVSIVVMNLSIYDNFRSRLKKVVNSKIRLSYSMTECTEIPKLWVNILNKEFDAVMVPDSWLIDVYKKSGVKIPIFVLPLAQYLEPFLEKEVKRNPSCPFSFGVSATFIERKNYDLLIDAFAKQFGNSKDVILKIHGRYGPLVNKINKKIEDLNLKNVEIISKELNAQEYLNFMSGLDCYVFLSKGEGFSHTPREAFALGIPVILSDNTSHRTICQTGFCESVKSMIKKIAKYEDRNEIIGFNFDCEIDDVCKAMSNVYNNWNFYRDKAILGRSWVQKYLRKNIRNYYLSIVKPKKVILGHENKIEEDCLITNSSKLYNKYLEIIKI